MKLDRGQPQITTSHDGAADGVLTADRFTRNLDGSSWGDWDGFNRWIETTGFFLAIVLFRLSSNAMRAGSRVLIFIF